MRDFLGAFCRLTGLSATFQVTRSHEPAPDFSMCRNSFCQLLQKYPGGESLCERTHDEARERAHKLRQPVKTRCPFGLSTIAVPVEGKDGSTGTVLTGEVLLRPPSKSKLDRQLRKLFREQEKRATDRSRLWDAFRKTRVITRGQFQALAKTVKIAAEGMGAEGIEATEAEGVLAALAENPGGEVQVKARVARWLVRENSNVAISGIKRYMRVKHHEGGVYKVTLGEVDGKQRTILVK